MRDIMLHSTKNAYLKKARFNFIYWCRRVKWHAEVTGTATELVEAPRKENLFKAVAVDMLYNDLTSEQQEAPKYQSRKNAITGAISARNDQRSLSKEFRRSQTLAYLIIIHGISLFICLPILLLARRT